MLWDADNRLVMCNTKYQQLHELGERDIRPGTPYARVMKAARQPIVRQPTAAEEPGEDGACSRITSYNVCYTKLLRSAPRRCGP